MNFFVSVQRPIPLDDGGTGTVTVDAGGISINGNVNSSPSISLLQEVDDYGTAEIIVQQDGYHPYSVTIDNVYTGLKYFYVLLVPIVSDISDNNYNRSYPRFTTFEHECSFKADAYVTSSFVGDLSWYVNNEYLKKASSKETFEFCFPGQYQIKLRNTSYELNCNTVSFEEFFATQRKGNDIRGEQEDVSIYLNNDLNVNLHLIEYRPELNVSINSSSSSFIDSNDCCNARYSTITVFAEPILNRAGATESEYTISYLVEDPQGIEIFSFEDTLDNNAEFQFTNDELGSYTITVSLTDNFCDSTYTSVYNVESCNFINLNYIDCNTYSIENKSNLYDVTLNIESIDGTVVAEDLELKAGYAYNVVLNEISLYFIEVTYNNGGSENIIESYVINNYCMLEDCLAQYILDILCPTENRCSPCPDEVELNQMLLLTNTYFMKLHSEYAWNNYYTFFTDTILDKFTTLQQVMNKLKEFCSRRACLSQSFPGTPIVEGPYDMAGKGCNWDNPCYVNTSNIVTTGCKTCG